MTGTTSTGPAGGLTDGTGISRLTGSKVLKDLVADFLLSGSAALVSAQVLDIGSAIQTPQVAGFAVAGALIRVLYRFILRWATTP